MSTTHISAASDTNEAFAVEQNGINLIPEIERKGSASELAWVFGGANLVFVNAISGSLLATLGLNYPQMLAIILSGNLLWLIVGYGGIPGARTGTATMVISRAAFGRQGNVVPALLSWLTVVGWEAVNLVLGAFALYSLADVLGHPLDTTGKVIALAIVTVATFGVAILGHRTIVVMQRFFTWALALIMVGLIPQVWAAPPLPISADAPYGASLATLAIAFTLIAALPISFTNYPADYTRYLPSTTSGKSITFWTFLGAYIATAMMMILGFVAAKAANLTDPVAGFQPLLAPWYFKLFLLIVLGGTMTNNFVNTYSSGMSLLAAGLNVSRPIAIIIDGLIATVMAAYAIFFYDFTPGFVLFLSLMVAWLAPWAGVYTADIWLRNSKYSGSDLLADDGGQYGRWNLSGYVAWLAGVGVALACTTADLFKSPFAEQYLGGADLSIAAGFLVSAVLYIMLARRSALPA